MSDEHFEFEIKGSVKLECEGKCGKPPKYVIVALEIKEQMESKDFPRLATCGDCKISYGGKPEEEKESDPLGEIERGVKIGKDIGEAAEKIYNLFQGRKSTGGSS